MRAALVAGYYSSATNCGRCRGCPRTNIKYLHMQYIVLITIIYLYLINLFVMKRFDTQIVSCISSYRYVMSVVKMKCFRKSKSAN